MCACVRVKLCLDAHLFYVFCMYVAKVCCDCVTVTWTNIPLIHLIFPNPLTQDLVHQVSAMKESLTVAGKLSEQLEDRMEEIEEENKTLCGELNQCQGELKKRDCQLQQLQAKFEEQEVELSHLKADYRGIAMDKKVLEKELLEERNNNSSTLSKTFEEMDEMWRLKEELDNLRQKFNECNREKDRLTRELSTALHENERLEHRILQTEETVDELRHKLASAEEVDGPCKASHSSVIRRTRSMRYTTSYSSPHRSSFKLSSSSHNFRNHRSPLSSVSTNTTNSPVDTTGISLWNELDTQCADLQERFDRWVDKCNCSASLEYRQYLKSTPEKSQEEQTSREQTLNGQPLKEMFDELFASLRETAAVANRLLSVENKPGQ